MTASPPPPADVFAAGEVLSGTYQIHEVLGRSAAGQVFEAHDSMLNRRVAIKVAWPHVPATALRKEAEGLAAVRHTSVSAVHAIGQHRGIEYVVMERLYGMSLEAHLARDGDSLLPLDEVVGLLKRIVDGLAAVHRAGIAHRDLKPKNVILAANERVALVDFGLVLPADVDVIKDETLVGSPLYMAPEVISNSVAPGAGHLVDLYAIGVIAFEMLAGKPPFLADSTREILKKHLHEEPPDIAARRTDVPPRLLALVRALMAKTPQERPKDAEAVLWALEHLAHGPPPRTLPLNVLVVDDDAHIAKVLAFYVKKAVSDAVVRVASDGDGAIEAVLDEEPDLMLLDLNMPRMSGIEVCMFLRGTKAAERCTIVALSAGAQETDVQLLRTLGVTTFIQKGATLATAVGELVRSALEKTRS